MNAIEVLEMNEYQKATDLLIESSTNDAKEENYDTWKEQYDGDHEILKRRDKIIGTEEGSTTTVTVAKEVITYQKKIVLSAVSFLFGEPVELILSSDEKTEEAYRLILKLWKENKLDYFNRRLMNSVCRESDSAELWFTVEKEDGIRLRASMLSAKNGNDIYAHFDDDGDMDAFINVYKSKNSEGKNVQHRDTYTAARIYKASKAEGEQGFTIEEIENPIGKIPVVYYRQNTAEWTDVQTLIDRSELLISKHADSNDYFSSPSVKVSGELKNPPEKGEVGKLFEMKPYESDGGKISYGDISYLTWDQTPESLKLEYEQLKNLIYSMTSTPDLSFGNVKGVGNLSGIAMRFMFLDAILKSKDKQEIYGEGIYRRISIMSSMLSLIEPGQAANFLEMEIDIKFGSILPQSDEETIKNLSMATAGLPTMSQQTAVSVNPYTENAMSEKERMDREEEAAQNSLGAESFTI